MSRLWIWIIGLILLVITSFLIYKLYQQEWEEVSLVVGLQTQAREDPIFVLNKLLGKHAKSVDARENFDHLFDPLNQTVVLEPRNTGLILDERLFADSTEKMEALYNWVQSGGHLVYVVSSSRTDEKTNWLFDHISPGLVRADDSEKPIYDVTGDSDSVNATTGAESDVALDLYIPYRFVLEECHDFTWEVLNDDYQTLACHRPIGRGHMTVLTDMSFANGFGLRIADNASLAIMVFSSASVYSYYRPDKGFDWFSQILGQYWANYALLGLLLVLSFWNLYTRFGPSLVPVEARYSHYGQHLQNLGRFYRQNEHEQQLKRVLLIELDAIMELKESGYSAASTEKKRAILVKKTSISEIFATNLLDIENISENALWLEQVQFVKELKV